jgi:hypothetical protein
MTRTRIQQTSETVIPGRRKAANRESMNTGLWNIDSGFGPAGRPGMTIREQIPTKLIIIQFVIPGLMLSP